MSVMQSTIRSQGFSIPSAATLGRLFLGGFAGLMIWEIWARLITPLFLDGPLEPAGLVISLVKTWTGYDLPRFPAEVAHYVIGIIGYPTVYFLLSRLVKRWALLLDIGVWAIFTAYLAYSLATGPFDSWKLTFWVIVTGVTATRAVNPNSLIADCVSWGSFTWFNALGIMAPLAGLPFLLMEWGGGLSFMSYVGHIIYGFVAAYVFESLERRAGAS
jgi:hypothetical protein